MMNITQTLNEYLLSQGLEDITIIYNDLYPEPEGNAVLSRHDPSQAKATEYLDGSSEGVLQISYYARSKSASWCRQTLQEISNILDCVSLDDVTDDDVIYNVSVQTLPNFISLDDKGQSIYTIEINANYIHGGY